MNLAILWQNEKTWQCWDFVAPRRQFFWELSSSCLNDWNPWPQVFYSPHHCLILPHLASFTDLFFPDRCRYLSLCPSSKQWATKCSEAGTKTRATVSPKAWEPASLGNKFYYGIFRVLYVEHGDGRGEKNKTTVNAQKQIHERIWCGSFFQNFLLCLRS